MKPKIEALRRLIASTPETALAQRASRELLDLIESVDPRKLHSLTRAHALARARAHGSTIADLAAGYRLSRSRVHALLRLIKINR